MNVQLTGGQHSFGRTWARYWSLTDHLREKVSTTGQKSLFKLFMYTKLALYHTLKNLIYTYWVNPSKRGGMDVVFRGLAGLLQGIPEERLKILIV